MVIDGFVVGVFLYIVVGLWLGMGKTSPLHDWANDHSGWYSVLFMFGGPFVISSFLHLF